LGARKTVKKRLEVEEKGSEKKWVAGLDAIPVEIQLGLLTYLTPREIVLGM
jgi:hypothetical protein